MNTQYPLSGIAKQLETQGRFGDTMLVHLNPVEVAGIASLSPTGKLTTNPETGLQEAFLPLLIPMLASWGGTAAAGAAGAGLVGSAVAGGLASGLATGAVTGDWERGLASGIAGAGLGGALAGAGAAGGAAAGAEAFNPDMLNAIGTGTDAAAALTNEQLTQAALDQAGLIGAGDIGVAGTDIGVLGSEGLAAAPEASRFSNLFGDASLDKFSGEGFKERLFAPFEEGSGLGEALMQKQALYPIAIGLGSAEQMRSQDKWNKRAGKLADEQSGDSDERRRRAFETTQAAYRVAQPNAPRGISPLREMYGWDNPYMPPGMAQGGIVSMAHGGNTAPIMMDGASRYSIPPGAYAGAGGGGGGGRLPAGYGDFGYGSTSPTDYIDAITIQQQLMGTHKVQPPAWFRPGIDAEFDYFQNLTESTDDEGNVVLSGYEAPIRTTIEDWRNMFRPFRRLDEDSEYLSSEDDENRFGIGKPVGMAHGGEVNLQTDFGPKPIPAGGVAGLESSFNPQAAQPTEQDIQMVAMALTGQAGDQSDQIIEAFVARFGPDVFQQVRQMILQSVQPNAQTEGLISGPGGGMDDQVQGTIGGNQPVAVSPGEFIVPADVVSGLGDGSSDAGAAELDQMMNNVRMARGGTTAQPQPFDARRVLPR